VLIRVDLPAEGRPTREIKADFIGETLYHPLANNKLASTKVEGLHKEE
jgi:hypothetical protein